MGLLKEFKEFAVRGNVIDLAVGVIIGGAFGAIVNSVVNDLIMPIIAGIIGAPDFTQMYISFAEIPKGTALGEARKLGPVFAYGNFLTVLLNFIIVAFAIFLFVKFINSLKRKTPPPETKAEVISSTDKLLIEIRDALRSGK